MRLRVACLPLLAGALFAAPPAAAECPEITPTIDAASPPDGATGMPLNAAITFGVTPRFAGYTPSVTLVSTSSGAAIPGTLTSGPAESYVFRPDFALSASTTYDVTIMDSSGDGTPLSFDFTTGTEADTIDPVFPEPPVLEVVEYRSPVREPGCQQPGYWVLHATWEPVENEAAVLYVLDVQLEDLVPQQIRDARSGAVAGALVASEAERSFNVPENSEVRVRIFAVDAAGRQAGTPESVIETPPAAGADSPAGCGCTLASPRGSFPVAPALGLLALAAVFFRRRP